MSDFDAKIIELGLLQRHPGDILLIKAPPNWPANSFHGFRNYLDHQGLDPYVLLPGGTELEILAGDAGRTEARQMPKEGQ